MSDDWGWKTKDSFHSHTFDEDDYCDECGFAIAPVPLAEGVQPE